MKVTVIGGGSTYTPELVKGFLEHVPEFPIEELWLMDIDRERLQIVGGFAERMVRARGMPFKVILTTDRHAAIEGSSYVITQFRVGQMQARREDEYLGRRHGLIGQETTGVGGMAKALRTIPVVLEIADDMRKFAPNALLVNFTNPAGLVTQAISQYAPDIQAIGVCNVPITTKMGILELLRKKRVLDIEANRAQLLTLGLNHLSWHRGFLVDGEDIWDTVMLTYLEWLRARPADEREWDLRTIEVLNMIPNYYLQYYYYTAKKLREQEAWPPSRAEVVMQVERQLLEKYAEPDRVEPPPELMKRGGAYYSTMATELLNAHYNDLGTVHVVNIRQESAVQGWPAEWVLEMPCRVSRQGIDPLPTDPLPPAEFGLLAHVKAYELLTVEASVHGDREAAYRALLAHPLGPSADEIQNVLDDMLETHRKYLPQFWT